MKVYIPECPAAGVGLVLIGVFTTEALAQAKGLEYLQSTKEREIDIARSCLNVSSQGRHIERLESKYSPHKLTIHEVELDKLNEFVFIE